MPQRLVTTWYGTFLLGDDGSVLGSTTFPRSVEEIAARLEAMRRREVLDEERGVAPAEGAFLVSDARLLALEGAEAVSEGSTAISPPSSEDLGYGPELLREASIELAARAVREALPADQPVVLYLRAMDLLEREVARSLEHLRHWYGFHFPELAALVDEATFLELLQGTPDRSDLIKERPDLDPGTEPGRPLKEGEGDALRTLAGQVAATRRSVDSLKASIEEAMGTVAPNLAVVAGPLVGARLLSLAGSLERLSRMPSSTVQLLGAERALFLHIREAAPAPKHGVLFQHPSVHSAPPWLRGRIARALAGKVSIASRGDASGTHTEGELGRDMREQFLKRARQLRRDHPEPPPGWRPRPPRREGTGPRRGKGRGRRGGPRGTQRRSRDRRDRPARKGR